MNYNEWIDKLNIIESTRRNTQVLEELEKEEINSNFDKQLSDRIQKVIIAKLKKVIKKTKRDISMLKKDSNALELIINNFKKDLLYIRRITLLKQLNEETRLYYLNQIYLVNEETFNLIEDESLKIDDSGIYKQIIKRKRIKKDEIL